MLNLRDILSSINDAVWSFDITGNKFIYTNNRLSDLYQIPLNEIEESPRFWLRFVHPDDYQYAVTESENIFSGKNVEIEYRLLVNNKIKWVCDKKVVLLNEDQKPTVITGILSDITAKKASESQLSDIRKIYRSLFINNPNPLWVYDKKTLKFLAVNHAAIAIYGYSLEEFLRMTIADIRPKEDLQKLLDHVYNVKDTYNNSKIYWKHLKKNGEILYVNISGHGINHHGHDAEIVMAHDITLEVESRKKITLAKKNLDALINSINDDIWSIDKNYCLISANNSYQKTFMEVTGREVMMGESVFISEYSEEDKKQWKNYYDRALKGETFTFTEFVSLPGKEPFCAETKLHPISNNNKIIGVACVSTNIQGRLDAHKKIVEQNVKLREVISLASHEIRGPVASLLGLISAFNKDNPTDPFNKEVMNLITDVTLNLDTVLHKLIDKSYSLKQEKASINSAQHNQSVNE